MTTAGAGEPLDMLVCTKFVPDPNQLQADSDGRPDLARAPFRISTFDENAIEAALQLRAVHGGRVVGVSLVGDQLPPRDVLLRALAMGLDALYVIKDDLHVAADPLRVAILLAAAAHAVRDAESIREWRLVLCGEASADQYNAQLGPRLAVALGLPAVTYAARLEIEGGKLVADRSLESRSETVECESARVGDCRHGDQPAARSDGSAGDGRGPQADPRARRERPHWRRCGSPGAMPASEHCRCLRPADIAQAHGARGQNGGRDRRPTDRAARR